MLSSGRRNARIHTLVSSLGYLYVNLACVVTILFERATRGEVRD